MLLWFAGLAVVLVWQVFRDPAMDYRLVVVGVLLPDALDAPFGGARLAHTLVASVILLVGVMVATRGRRGLRRRLLALPVGTLLHLLLDGMWARTTGFLWPLGGGPLPDTALPSLARPLAVVLVQEAVGLSALAWWWRRFRLGEAERWRAFARTGRLGRDLVG